jgi:kynurenine/2-aminoadipate aminotransferase
MDFDPNTYLTHVSKQRQPSAIRALSKLMSTPGMISFGGGLPNPTLFPIGPLSIKINEKNVTLTAQETHQMLQVSYN